MATMTISISDASKAFFEEQAARKGFGSLDEYMSTLLVELERREAKRDLDAKLLEGLNSGPAVDLTRDEWEAMEREAKRELDAKLLEGLNSGTATPMTREDWDALERRIWERHRAGQPS